MVVGVDVSSHRIDLAYLDEQGRPQRWHQELAKGHLIDRLRSIRIEWPTSPPRVEAMSRDAITISGPLADVTDIAIEMPFGRSRTSVAALMSTVGVITRQAPPWARVAWPSAGELRAAIGARNTKQDAHRVICEHVFDHYHLSIHNNWDEHELDALTACIGWTAILEAQDAT